MWPFQRKKTIEERLKKATKTIDAGTEFIKSVWRFWDALKGEKDTSIPTNNSIESPNDPPKQIES